MLKKSLLVAILHLISLISFSQDIVRPSNKAEWSKLFRGISSTNDPRFKYIKDNRREIDSLYDTRKSTGVLQSVIYRQWLEPAVTDANRTPDWKAIYREVSKQGEDGIEIFTRSRALYYFNKKDYETFSKFMIPYFNKYSERLTNLAELNNFAYTVFQHVERKKFLKAALSWSDASIALSKESSPHAMDTKANLLYKLGKVTEACALENEAINVARSGRFGNMVPELETTLKKMKQGQPTWIVSIKKRF